MCQFCVCFVWFQTNWPKCHRVYDRKFQCKCVLKQVRMKWNNVFLSLSVRSNNYWTMKRSGNEMLNVCVRKIKLNYKMLIKKVARSQNNYTSIECARASKWASENRRKFDRLCDENGIEWCKKSAKKTKIKPVSLPLAVCVDVVVPPLTWCKFPFS